MALQINAENVKRGEVFAIPLSQLIINHDKNTRYAPPPIADVIDLAEDIDAHGQIQPITVLLNSERQPEVRAGFTRCAAFKYLSEKRGEDPLVKCMVMKGNDQDATMLSISENMRRVGLSPMDYAHMVRILEQRYSMSPKEIALKLGKSDAWVTQKMRLLELDTEHQQLLHNGEMAENAAWSLLTVPSEKRTEVVEAVKEVVAAKKAAAPPAPPTKKAAAKKVASITDNDVRRVIRNTEAVPSDAQPARKLKEIRNYIEETIDTEPNDSPMKDYYKVWIKFFDGKISEKQMDNASIKFIGTSAPEAKSAKAGKK